MSSFWRGQRPVWKKRSIVHMLFLLLLLLYQRVGFATAEDDSEPYLWTFQETVDGRTEPQKMRLHDTSRPWFQQLMRAEMQLSRGRLGEAESYYRTILKRFAVPAAEEMAVHVNLGHVRIEICGFCFSFQCNSLGTTLVVLLELDGSRF